MADVQFPNQHTTTTVTSNTAVQTDLRFETSYLKTIPGILKCIQITLNLIGFICIQATGIMSQHSRGGWFSTVSMGGFWFTAIMLAFYLFHVIEKFYKIPWLKIEFLFCTIWTFLYLIAACLAATFIIEGYVVAGFFGFCAMVAYGFDAFLKFRAIRNGELAQGERVINKQTTTMRSPTGSIEQPLDSCFGPFLGPRQQKYNNNNNIYSAQG